MGCVDNVWVAAYSDSQGERSVGLGAAPDVNGAGDVAVVTLVDGQIEARILAGGAGLYLAVAPVNVQIEPEVPYISWHICGPPFPRRAFCPVRAANNREHALPALGRLQGRAVGGVG